MNDSHPPIDHPYDPVPARKPRSCPRAIVRILKILVISYVGLIMIFFLLQTWIIFPGASTQGHLDAIPHAGAGATVVSLTTPDHERVVALHAMALDEHGRVDPGAKDQPTLIFFYGNAMCLAGSEPLIDRFRRLGFNVVCPDYQGYGASSGKPSEKGCQAAAMAVYDYLVDDQGVEPGRIVVMGWSLGGGVAVDLAARRRVGGLAVFSAFTSVVEMAQKRMPILPVSLLLRHRFENLKKIPSITVPTLIGHGKADPIVPFAMGLKLAGAAGGPVETLWVEGAGHNDFFETAGRSFDDALKRLREQVLRR